ncbi:hypothetical protein BJ165DRAFT_352691 [Panaeolus papilionaceus]|nr:hypothetical protein BJ165DRAFT_352691 [Panaeolus papilionaceus]
MPLCSIVAFQIYSHLLCFAGQSFLAYFRSFCTLPCQGKSTFKTRSGSELYSNSSQVSDYLYRVWDDLGLFQCSLAFSVASLRGPCRSPIVLSFALAFNSGASHSQGSNPHFWGGTEYF